jgi:hypothetical protein
MTSKPLRQRMSQSGTLRRLAGARGRGAHELLTAAALLGDDHRLVRTLELLAVLRRQLLVTSLVLASGVLAIAGGVAWASAVIAAAALVELVLLAASLALRSLQRALALELIIDGRGDLPFCAVARERQRLTSPCTQASLVRALEGLIRTAATWPRIYPSARPVFDVRQVRAATPQLKDLADLLSAQPAQPRAVALIERLLTSGASPLYGQQPDELRGELERIHRELARDDAHLRGA